MTIIKKNLANLATLIWACVAFASSLHADLASDSSGASSDKATAGWSVDLGLHCTRASLTSPPTYTGCLAGGVGKITYQEPEAIFGQLRVRYTWGDLNSSQNATKNYEWSTELVAGHVFSLKSHWSLLLYLGLGVSSFRNGMDAYASTSSLQLNYETYYALVGLQSCYRIDNWSLGVQLECLPTLRQYLSIKDLSGSCWALKRKVGLSLQLPIGYEMSESSWLEVAPYYRWTAFGASRELALPQRNLTQVGACVAWRFFI